MTFEPRPPPPNPLHCRHRHSPLHCRHRHSPLHRLCSPLHCRHRHSRLHRRRRVRFISLRYRRTRRRPTSWPLTPPLSPPSRPAAQLSAPTSPSLPPLLSRRWTCLRSALLPLPLLFLPRVHTWPRSSGASRSNYSSKNRDRAIGARAAAAAAAALRAVPLWPVGCALLPHCCSALAPAEAPPPAMAVCTVRPPRLIRARPTQRPPPPPLIRPTATNRKRRPPRRSPTKWPWPCKRCVSICVVSERWASLVPAPPLLLLLLLLPPPLQSSLSRPPPSRSAPFMPFNLGYFRRPVFACLAPAPPPSVTSSPRSHTQWLPTLTPSHSPTGLGTGPRPLPRQCHRPLPHS